MHISYDKSSGNLFIPNSIFNENKEDLIKTLKDFAISDSNENFVIISSPKSLRAKTEYSSVFVNGSEKQVEKSCIFCTERIRCMTSTQYCYGLSVRKNIQENFEDLSKILTDKGYKILESKVNY